VTNLETGKSATVTIEDRGPHIPGRIVDPCRPPRYGRGDRPHPQARRRTRARATHRGKPMTVALVGTFLHAPAFPSDLMGKAGSAVIH